MASYRSPGVCPIREKLEDIINFAEVQRISINLLSANICFLGIPISRIYLFHQINIPSIDPALSITSFSISSIVVHEITPARCNRLKFQIILTAINTMWQFKNSAFSFCLEICILYGFILSLWATPAAAIDSGFLKFFIYISID